MKNQKIDFSVLLFWSILTSPPKKVHQPTVVNSPETGFSETRREKTKFENFRFSILQYPKFKDFTFFSEKNENFSFERRIRLIGAGNVVAARKNDLSQLFQPVARSYDKITSFQSAPTVRISARKPSILTQPSLLVER